MKRIICLCLCLFLFFCGYSQDIYNKDALTILADSLHNEGQYESAMSLRKRALKTHGKSSKEYQLYLKAKYFHTKSSDLEFKSYNYHNPDKAITKKAREKYLDSALQSAVKARDLYLNVKRPDRMFQYQIQNRIYHQTAYLGNWKQALVQAQFGYTLLKDTLSSNDKTFVDLIYDIGFIYSKLGDYSKSVENYQSSLDLYQHIIGENNTDVAQAYNNIAVEYRHLGLRKKELESLLKAKTIWERLNNADDQQFLYRCYGNLFYWYSYYGDFDKAEEYILKKKKLRDEEMVKKAGFIRNKEEIYQDKLSEWYDLMLHYSRKKDTIETLFFANKIITTIDFNKELLNFEVITLSSTLKFYASLLENENNEEALMALDKAIDIADKYSTTYYTKSYVFELYKVELLLKSKKYVEAKYILEGLKSDEEISNRFKLAILNAKTAEGLHQNQKASRYFEEAFSVLNSSGKDIEQVSMADLKPMISFETIDGFLAMGDFYSQLCKIKNSNEYLKKATHRYLLASENYNQLYLGQRYNERLFTKYNDINERLLEVGMLQSKDENLLTKILNTIENNGSKLTWSKFVFNNQRHQFKISEHFLDQEENLKAQINFYHNEKMGVEENYKEKIELWNDKIYQLNGDLVKIQDSIKQENKNYYDLNVNNFDVSILQKSLKDDEMILKYILTNNHLYTFVIVKNKIELLPEIDKTKTLNALKICLSDLKQRNPNYEASFSTMHKLLFNKVDLNGYKKLTIIPDGALNYVPFEAFQFGKKMPSISYASSLLLYQEQKADLPDFKMVHVGAFSASNNYSKLPKASDEINAVLEIFKGKSYVNASKNDFLQNAKTFNILHLAMHSNIDNLNPEFSSLNFYGENDNKLFISELYNETLNAKMAVLSACDTGNGFYENGEGVISLSRAFNYAGIPSTVMSLWKVDDEATAKIMTYFYEHLNKGESKDTALKNAKLDYLKNTDDELLKHPYYWSGFVLTGNTDALVESQSYWYYLFILPFLGLVMFRKCLFQLLKK